MRRRRVWSGGHREWRVGVLRLVPSLLPAPRRCPRHGHRRGHVPQQPARRLALVPRLGQAPTRRPPAVSDRPESQGDGGRCPGRPYRGLGADRAPPQRGGVHLRALLVPADGYRQRAHPRLRHRRQEAYPGALLDQGGRANQQAPQMGGALLDGDRQRRTGGQEQMKKISLAQVRLSEDVVVPGVVSAKNWDAKGHGSLSLRLALIPAWSCVAIAVVGRGDPILVPLTKVIQLVPEKDHAQLLLELLMTAEEAEEAEDGDELPEKPARRDRGRKGAAQPASG